MKDEVNYLIAGLESSLITSRIFDEIEEFNDSWKIIDQGLLLKENGIVILKARDIDSLYSFSEGSRIPKENILIIEEGAQFSKNKDDKENTILTVGEDDTDEAIEYIFSFIMSGDF